MAVEIHGRITASGERVFLFKSTNTSEVLNERNFKIDLLLLETINWHLIRGLQLIINYRGKIISALHSQLAPDTCAKLPARVRLEDAFS